MDDVMVDDDGDEWIPLGAVARRMGISRAAVYGRVKRGTLEAKRKGNRGLLIRWQGDVEHDVTETITHDVAHDVMELREERAAERIAAALVKGELVAELRHSQGLAKALAAERTRGDRLEAALTEARRSWWERLVAAIGRRP
jgi:hypothetical protein